MVTAVVWERRWGPCRCGNEAINNVEGQNNDVQETCVSRDVTDKICDYIDRYWNGSQSLHQNQIFITAVNQLIHDYSLAGISRTKDEILDLRENIHHLEEKNNSLKERLFAPKTHQKTNERDEVSDIKRTNRILKDEIGELRRRLEASEKMSEITDLLKQSHDSLITTNEQLRNQLSQQNKPFKSKGY